MITIGYARGYRRRRMRMTYRRLPGGARTLLAALILTVIGLAWVWKGAWFERVSHRQLTLERQEAELRIEANNLKRQILQLSQYARVEKDARDRLGMVFPNTPPDTIWTEAPALASALGTMAFFYAPLPSPPAWGGE